MPVTIELIVLMLLAYALGVGIGWAFWGAPQSTPENQSGDAKETKDTP